jgi:O-antigen biosynthesis protein WbqP
MTNFEQARISFFCIRSCDYLIALILTPVFLFFYFLLCIFYLPLRINPLFHQRRIGHSGKVFTLIKFRTMYPSAPHLPSHLCSSNFLLPGAKLIRTLKIDELPQCINILRGEMSLVGPRPNLTNQYLLIEVRSEGGIYSVLPGITGYAQVKGIDMSAPHKLLSADIVQVSNTKNLFFYLSVLMGTFLGRGSRDALSIK